MIFLHFVTIGNILCKWCIITQKTSFIWTFSVIPHKTLITTAPVRTYSGSPYGVRKSVPKRGVMCVPLSSINSRAEEGNTFMFVYLSIISLCSK